MRYSGVRYTLRALLWRAVEQQVSRRGVAWPPWPRACAPGSTGAAAPREAGPPARRDAGVAPARALQSYALLEKALRPISKSPTPY